MNTHPFRPVQGRHPLNLRGTQTAILFLSLCLCLWTGTSRASNLDFAQLPTTEILLAQRAIADTAVAAAPIEPQIPSAAVGIPSAGTDGHKSPGRAFLYNILVPGAGHLYAGNKRGWAHLGAEGVAWVTYFYYHERGTNKEDEYLAHADEHWDMDRYHSACQCEDSPEDSLINYFKEHNKQHYYEDIVKLNAYAGGWDDPANRNFNRGMRNDSNNFLKNAHYAVVGGFVNRVVSAFDVLRMLKRQTRSMLGEDTQVRFRLRTKPFSDDTAVGIEIRKKL